MQSAQAVYSDAIVESRRDEFLVSTDRTRLDRDAIHGFLTNCYWAKGIPREVVARSIEHSLCFGVYDGLSKGSQGLAKESRPGPPERHGTSAPVQVGFARVVSDFATVAYLGDVFILESHRGRGLSKWLMECITGHPALQNLRRWILLTRDAHALYARFGFTPLKSPARYMELHRPDIYETRETT